ncbi:MAG: hypothetical protein R3348_09990 [Xanthomonadales bacterium]|nr:hypothetical protein [Xanthomonadales bacterium]
MNQPRTSRFFLFPILLATAPLALLADDSLDDRIAKARSAAPPSVSAYATIVVDGEVVVEGSNGWVCMPDLMPGDGAPVCLDEVWQEMVAAVGEKAPFEASRIGVSYMLPGDPEGSGVSNSDPYHPNPTEAEDYIETGPHLMIIVPKAVLEGVTDDPSSGGPYVMWKDTDYAHLMVPVE